VFNIFFEKLKKNAVSAFPIRMLITLGGAPNRSTISGKSESLEIIITYPAALAF